MSAAPAAAAPAAPEPELVSVRYFECFTPPPANSIKGTLVPRILSRRVRRKVSMEVYRHTTTMASSKKDGSGGNVTSYDECSLRLWDPANKEERKLAHKRAKEARKNAMHHPSLLDEDGVEVELEEDEVEDDETLMPEGAEAFLTSEVTALDVPGWKSKYKFPLGALRVKGLRKMGVQVEITLGRTKQAREFLFDSPQDALAFRTAIEQQYDLENTRAAAKMRAVLGHAADATEQLTILVEVVSGWNIPAGDFTSSDPYVICLFRGKEVHRTKYISKTLDPIWTLKHNSLFLLEVSAQELFMSEGIVFLLHDYDKVGKNETLGTVVVEPKAIYQGKGDRVEYKVLPPPGKKKEVPGYMAFRFRRASDYDKEFMESYAATDKQSLAVFEKARENQGGAGQLKSMLRKRTRVPKTGRNAGKTEYKVHPGPDPKRVDETTWLTLEEMDTESKKDSVNWVDIGTGRLGRLFVEVLGCDELPNLDTGGFAGNLTDSFVSLVFEDACVTTDIIDDSLCPRWMPWSKRAFIFHMFHTSSQLYLGVFDHDKGMDDHDLIGRVSVDVANLRPDTLYTLKYDLYSTSRMTPRTREGTVTLRLRMEIADPRKMILSNLEPPPDMHVNVKKRKDFRVVRATVMGKVDMDKYNMKVINSYIEELVALQHVQFYLEDAIMALLLWRSTTKFSLGEKFSFKFPIHSLTAFCAAVTMVERPNLMPSFFFFGLAWLLLAGMDYRSHLPDKWNRCKTFLEFFQVLVLGTSHPPDKIKRNDNYEEAQAHLEAWKKRVEDAEASAKKKYEEQVKAQEELEKEMEEIGDADADIATKQGSGVSIDPFKPILYPVQQNLGLLVQYVRHAKWIFSWEESYLSFCLTCGCFVLSLVCYFVPWFFLMKWTARIVVWTVFGPWMKLVDIYYVSKIKPPTEEEEEKKKQEAALKRQLATSAAASEARIKRENAAKLKAMKKYMFGKFILRVPVLKEDRFSDLPLPESTAAPYRPELRPLSEVAMQEAGYHKTRVPGQHLVGDMIHKVAVHGLTDAPIGQATGHPDLVDKNGPGGAIKGGGSDSTASAYFKIGSLVVGAGVLTWFCVPLLAGLTEKAIQKWLPSAAE